MSQYTLSRSCQIDLLEKKSRFIGLGFPCASLHAFKEQLADLAAEYRDASHITYAFRIKDLGNINIGMSDAGEPKGTAGKPIYNHLEGQDLINVAIFVIRYFGGIKLGTGGLVKAYGNTARILLAAAPLIPFVERESFVVIVPYADFNRFEYQIMKFGASILEKSFAGVMSCTVSVPVAERATLIHFLREAFPTAELREDVNSSENSPSSEEPSGL